MPTTHKNGVYVFCIALAVTSCSGWSLSNPAPSDGGCAGPQLSRRSLLTSAATGLTTTVMVRPAFAQDLEASEGQVQVVLSGDAKKLFNEGRALELQGNIAAAQRLYDKVTKIAPRFIYGWSSLGNTQTVFRDLDLAEVSYSKSIDLCNESLRATEEGFGKIRCSDLYVLLLNRGSLRLNNGRMKDALADLQKASELRGRPDAVVLQNLARAEELNTMYTQADRDYSIAISMTANEVNPFWLRAALVKFQLGDIKGGFDLLKRVENRFPEAPEVRAAYATFLSAQGQQIEAQRKFLEIPDRQRLKYVDKSYLTNTIAWPPKLLEQLAQVTAAVGDSTSRT